MVVAALGSSDTVEVVVASAALVSSVVLPTVVVPLSPVDTIGETTTEPEVLAAGVLTAESDGRTESVKMVLSEVNTTAVPLEVIVLKKVEVAIGMS